MIYNGADAKMKGDYFPMKRNTFIRALCVALCAALFLGTFAILFTAVAAAEDEVEAAAVVLVEENEDEAAEPAAAAPVVQAEEAPNFLVGALDWFFRTFGFFGFTLDPYQFTIINQKPSFQWLLGFNNLYDTFPWVMNVWTDHFTCYINNFEGKDWRLQFWKGGYGLFLATGGEIGVYTKSPNQSIQHYGAPVLGDWLDIVEFSIYNRGKHLFTRPSPRLSGDVGPYWWVSGYRILSLCTDFFSSPRKNVVMDATINFKSVEMAQLFVASLPSAFAELTEGAMSRSNPEKYTIDGQVVRMIWQNVNQGMY